MRLIKALLGAVLFLAGCAGVLAGLGLAATGALAIKDQCPLGNDCHDARMVVVLGRPPAS